MTTLVVYLTGSNQQKRLLGLHLPRPAVPLYQADVEREHKANLAVLRDIRSRLEKLFRLHRDGIVSDKPVAGELD